MKPQHSGRFQSWRELIISPLVVFAILTAAAALTVALRKEVALGYGDTLAAFYLFSSILAITMMRILIRVCPLSEGTFSSGSNPKEWYAFSLRGCLCTTVLAPLMCTNLIPPMLRKPFYQILGCSFGSGIHVIGGRIMEPESVTIESNVIFGAEVLVLGHCVTGDTPSQVILGKVHIGRGAVIGARSIVWPGVEIGEGALVLANSVISPGTKIAPHEKWGGSPARKLA